MSKTTYISARLDEETKRRLLEIAKREDRSVSYLVACAIKEFVRKERRPQ